MAGDFAHEAWATLVADRGTPEPQLECAAPEASAALDPFVAFAGAYSIMDLPRPQDAALADVFTPATYISRDTNLRIRALQGTQDNTMPSQFPGLHEALIGELAATGYDATWVTIDAGHFLDSRSYDAVLATAFPSAAYHRRHVSSSEGRTMTAVETVLGPVDDSELGFVLSHEHVKPGGGLDGLFYPWLYDREATFQNLVAELSEAKAGGVDTIIDLTTPDLGRDVAYAAEAARASGVHVTVATGMWRDIPRGFWSRTADEIADIFVREIEVGIGDTGIKAGAIKVANDVEGVTPEAELVLRGAARALIRTGCPISTHHFAPDEVGRRQVKVFQEEGAPMDRICIGHSADSTDIDYLEDLLNTGVYLSMDRYPGREGRPNWEQRNATVQALVELGWAERLMLGHDYGPPGVRAGNSTPDRSAPTRYLFVTNTAIPAMHEAGVSDEAIDMMTREVPRRFLSGDS